MELEFEAVFEEGLEGEGEVVAGHVFDGGGDVVVFGVKPGGASNEPIHPDLVGDGDELADSHVAGYELAGSDVDVGEVSSTGCAGVDGGYFYLGAWWGLGGDLGCHGDGQCSCDYSKGVGHLFLHRGTLVRCLSYVNDYCRR